ncbi:MAG: GNAT family N-acetyltransferase [Chloroflexota bacterium]
MLSITPHSNFADLAADWERLLGASPARGPFLSWRWHSLWWESFAQPGDELLLLALRDGDGPVGIAPLLRRQGRLSFVAGTDVSDYLDLLVRRGEEVVVAEALSAYLLELRWGELALDSLAADSCTLRYLAPALGGVGLATVAEQQEVCPVVALPSDWEVYLASLSRKDRHELRRKQRRLESAGSTRFSALVDAEIGSQDVEDFLTLHRLSRPDKAAFMDEPMRGFFRQLFARFARDGLLRLYFLEYQEQRVAATLCFDWGEDLLLYNSGYDPAYAPLSVGLLLKAHCLRDAIALGRRRFDFLRGNERYKYDLGGVDVPVYGLRAVRSG